MDPFLARNGSPSAVPCTSTNFPPPVITTFMSVSHVRILGVIQIQHRHALDKCRPKPRRRNRGSASSAMACLFFRKVTASCSATKAPVMLAVRVPPSAWITSQSIWMVRSPSAARLITARRLRPIRRWISCVRPDCLPRAASRSDARIGGARQHAVLGGEPALALALQERRHLVLDAGGADHLGVAAFDQHRAFGVACIGAGDVELPQLIGARPLGRMAVLSFQDDAGIGRIPGARQRSSGRADRKMP